MKPVLVTWVDAISDDAWTDLKKAKELDCPHQQTLGFLFFENDVKIMVAATIDLANENVASYYAIPKTWIIEIQEINLMAKVDSHQETDNGADSSCSTDKQHAKTYKLV